MGLGGLPHAGGLAPAKRAGGIRGAIALLILIPVLVPLFAVLLIWLGERDVASAASDRVTSGARVVSANVRLLVESTRERLRVYDEKLGNDPAKFLPQQGAIENTLTVLFDAEGRPIQRNGARGVQTGANTEFTSLKEGAPWAITGMQGNSGSLRFFGIARRLERNGKFAGVVTTYIAADTLSDVWGQLALGPGSTVAMIRKDGWLVTRFPVPDKAINVYPSEHYPGWGEKLGLMLQAGAFGENFTTIGMTENEVCVGDVFRADELMVQVSQPRQPCWKLARRWRIKDLAAQVESTGRTGWYFRVLRNGRIQAGDVLTLVERTAPEWSVAAANEMMHHRKHDAEAAHALAACSGLSESWKSSLTRRAAGHVKDTSARLSGI